MTVTIDTLQTYLGVTEVDTDRATLLLSLVTQLVEPLAGTPIPDAADPIILSALTRAYLNPTNAQTQGAGPYSATIPAGGVYLTRGERATLARTLGLGSHFVIETLPAMYREAPK